jgi:hypothetical protein
MYNLETQQGIIGTLLIGPSVCVWRPMIPCCVSRLYIIDWSFCLCLAPNDSLLCL